MSLTILAADQSRLSPFATHTNEDPLSRCQLRYPAHYLKCPAALIAAKAMRDLARILSYAMTIRYGRGVDRLGYLVCDSSYRFRLCIYLVDRVRLLAPAHTFLFATHYPR